LEFLESRKELIQKRWSLKHSKRGLRKPSSSESYRDNYQEYDDKDPYLNSGDATSDPELGLELHSPLDRLVS
jgi:hypothetical protein